MKRIALLILLVGSLAGCTNMEFAPRRIAMLQQGMTQQEVASLLGKPHTVTRSGAFTVYDYIFTQPHPAVFNANQPPRTSYYVIIGQDGRVSSFGPN